MENTENDAKFIEINPLSKEFFTREFQKKNFFFNADKPSLIGSAQCERYQKTYILFRSLYVVFYCIRLIDIISSRRGWQLLLQFYTWSDLGLFLHYILHFICSVHVLKRLDQDKSNTPFLYKVAWVLHNLTWGISSLSVLFIIPDFCNGSDFAKNTLTYNRDWQVVIDTTIVLINLFVSGMPVRLFHFYPSVIFGLAFATFITVYWAVTGQVTCNTLDGYHHGTVFAILIGVYTPLFLWVHINFFMIYWMRLLMCRYLCCCWFKVIEDKIAGDDIDAEENVEPTEQEAVV